MPPEDNQQFTPQNDPPEDSNTDVPDSMPDSSESTVGSIAEPSTAPSESTESNDAEEPVEQTVHFPEDNALNSNLGPEVPEMESVGPEDNVEPVTPPEPAMNIEPTIAPAVEVPETPMEPESAPSPAPADIEALSATEPITEETISTTPSPVEAPSEQPVSVAVPPATSEPAVDPTAVAYAQATATLNSSPKGKSKVVKIVLLVLLGIVLIFGALFAFMVIGALQTPTYSNLKENSLVGYSGNNTGMTFSVPEQFKEANKTDLSATYVDYINDDEESKDQVNAEIAASVQSLLSGELTQDQVTEIISELETASNDAEELTGLIGDEKFDNVKLSSFTKDEAAGKVRIEITGDSKSAEDETIPGKIVLVLIVSKSGYVYTFGIGADNTVWDKNSDIFEEILNSVKGDQDVPETE